MKKNKLYIILAFSILSSSLLMSCQKQKPSVQISGEIDVEDDDLEEKTVRKKDIVEQYDFKNLPVPEPINPAAIIDSSHNFVSDYESSVSTGDEENKPIEVNTIYSYYARNLSNRSQLAYREILVGALNANENVAITKPIKKDELEKIMNIMFLDTPEAFMLEHKYEYTTDSSGNVSNVKLFFNMSKKTQKNTYDDYLVQLTNYSERIKQSKNTLDGVENTLSINFKVNNTRKLSDETKNRLYDNGIIPNSKSFESNNTYFSSETKGLPSNFIAASKAYVAILRDSGIDACVKVGTLLNPIHYKNDIEKSNIKINKIKDVNNLISEEQKSNGTTKVTCDFKDFYSWICVKINGQWYNIDPYLLSFTKFNVSESVRNTIFSSSPLFLVDDYLMSQSRMFYINDILLGQSEPSTNRIFQPIYRKGKYVPEQDSERLSNFMDSIVEKMSETDTNMIFYQFSSRENFSEFNKKFDERVTLFNKQYKNPIRRYKIYKNEELLTIIIYDITKKDMRTR